MDNAAKEKSEDEQVQKCKMNVSCSDVLLHKDEKMLDQGDGGRLGGRRRRLAAGGEVWRGGVRVDEP